MLFSKIGYILQRNEKKKKEGFDIERKCGWTFIKYICICQWNNEKNDDGTLET